MKKKMNCAKNTMVLGIILFVLYSCSSELTIQMPKGPAGPAGASAYDVWVQAVKDGTIVWDTSRTDINNYFLYLKGQDGKDGTNGTNGSDGQSAYQLWVQAVAAGIDDPHNAGQQWPKNETSIQDFWNYLAGAPGQAGSVPYIGTNGNWFIDGNDTGSPSQGKNGTNGQDGNTPYIGANGNWFIDGVDTKVEAFGQNGAQGQSAYDLWVQEVTSATGLEDPHNRGQLWPTDKTSTQDFWDYLRGEDAPITQPGGDTGQPGEDIKIIPGVPNVIAQYVSQNYNEFVRWNDGSVGYIVYNNTGGLAAYAQVSGLPGVKNPAKIYTADADGFFSVPKEDLPDNLPVANRRGTAIVDGVTSAPNTYVPDRMYVKMILQSDPVIDGTYISFTPLIERETDGKDWEVIPSYLGNVSQRIVAYALSSQNDATPYNAATSNTYTTAESTVNISLHTNTLRVNRLRKEATYYTPDNLWDGDFNHYFTLVLDSYYGETPQLAAVIKMAPIQAMPMIQNVSATGYNSTTEFFTSIQGTMDVTGANLDYNLFFKNTFDKATSGSVTYFSPVVEDPVTVNNSQQFTVRFSVTGNNSNNNSSRASVSVQSFKILTPYIGSSVILECTTSYFYSLNTIGYLRFGTAGDLNTLKIVKRTANPDGWRYIFADMPVSYTP